MKTAKRWICLILCVTMVAGLLTSVYATEGIIGDEIIPDQEEYAYLNKNEVIGTGEIVEYIPSRSAEDYRAWTQSDSRWGSILMGASGITIAKEGCLVTSVTKLIIQAGLRDSDSFTVATLATWLNNNSGYVYPGNALYWGKPAACVSGFSNYGDILTYSTYSSSGYNDQILAWIRQGKHMAINVNSGGHWVAVDEAKSLATGQVYIMDSISGYQNCDLTLSSRYSVFNSIHAYTGGSTPPETISVALNANGGSCATSSITIKPGDSIGTLPIPTRSGYDFAGWHTDTVGNSDPVTASDTFSSNTTLYAHWANMLYQGNKVSFELNGGNIEGDVSSQTITGFNIYRNIDYLVIFNCGGQLIDSNVWGAEARIDYDGEVLALRGYGDENQFTVPNGGFVISGHDAGKELINQMKVHDYVAYNKSTNKAYLYTTQGAYLKDNKYVESGSNYGSLPEVKRDGYYFKGWTLDSYGSNFVNFLTSYDSSTLYAQWDSTMNPINSFEYDNHRYELYDYHMSWTEAEAFCEARGGHLVTITSATEQAKVLELAQTGSFCTYYIGCSDAEKEGTWSWITGELFDYQNWDTGAPEPSNGDGENYAHILTVDYGPNKQVGEWNDTENDKVYGFYGYLNGGFICEYDVVCDHEYSYQVTTPPTTTAKGTLTGFCSKCGGSVTVALPILNTTEYDKTVIAGNCATRPIERYTWKTTTYGDYYFDVVMGDDYSEWSIDYPTGVDESLIESRTEYRYSDYETTTSYNTSMTGWTQTGSEWQQSGSGTINYVASWPSGFNTSHSLYSQYNNSPKTASETETDKTVINSTGTAGWIYYHWCRGTYTGGPINRLTSPYYTSEFNSFHAFFSTDAPSGTAAGDGSYVNPNASCCTDSHWYYPITVSYQNYTTYKKLFTYERWTDWSEWSTEEYTPSDTRKVEMQTVYRYITTPIGEHSWNEGVITTPATCSATGLKTFTCTRCGETKTETIAKLEHNYQEAIILPSCTEQGYTSYTCIVCGDTYTDTYVDELGHDLIHHAAKAPTCTRIGWEAYDTCSRCDYTTYKEIKALGHDLIHHAAKAPTCTEIGWDAYDTCSRCDYSTYTEKAALGHNYQAVVTAPTCTEMGYTTYTCSRCGDSYVANEVAANGHTPGSSVEENRVDPTCTASGGFDTVTYCSACGAELSRVHTDLAALEHNWDDGVIVPATCTTNGSKTFTCKRCGEKRTETIAALGHTPGESAKENEAAATCTTAGGYDMVIRCTTCDAILYSEHYESPALGHNFVDGVCTVCGAKDPDYIVIGDVDGNGEVDTIDSIRLAKYLVDLVELTDEQIKAADVNGDGEVTATDAIRLAKYLVGLVDTLRPEPQKAAPGAAER